MAESGHAGGVRSRRVSQVTEAGLGHGGEARSSLRRQHDGGVRSLRRSQVMLVGSGHGGGARSRWRSQVPVSEPGHAGGVSTTAESGHSCRVRSVRSRLRSQVTVAEPVHDG